MIKGLSGRLASLADKTSVHLVLIVLLGLIVYSNTFNVPFQLDEKDFIENNFIIRNVGNFFDISKLKEHFFLKTRSLGYLSFSLNYRMHGLAVSGYHFVNLSIHSLNALLIYFLVGLTFKTPLLNMSSLKNQAGHIALFAALVFVSHPVQTEAVTYIFQRLASLAAFFYLASIVLYVKWRLTPLSSPLSLRGERGGLLYLLSLLSAILAMKTKENAFTLPVVITLYEFFFLMESSIRRMFYLAPFLLSMSLIPLSLTGIDKPVSEILREIGPVTHGFTEISRIDYLLTQFSVVVTYIRLLFLPVNQNFVYDYPLFNSFFTPRVMVSFLFILCILAFAAYLFHRSKAEPVLRLISFGLLWFFLTLSVESSFIPLPTLINEYRIYLPSAGFIVSIITAFFLLLQRFKYRTAQIVLITFLIFIIPALAYSAYVRNSIWRSEITLWEDVVNKSPRNALAHIQLGDAYSSSGMAKEAIEQYKHALILNPDSAEANNNICIAYLSMYMPDTAISHCLTALRLRPGSLDIYNNLGNAYFKAGCIPEAIESYKSAIGINPKDVTSHFNLGLTYFKTGSPEDARREFQTVLDIEPLDRQAKNILNQIKSK